VALQQLALHQHYNAMMMVDVFIIKQMEQQEKDLYGAMSEQMVSWRDNF